MGAQMTKVVKGLYLGAYSNASDVSDMMQYGISHILFIGSQLPEIDVISHCDYKDIIVSDKEDFGLIKRIPEANDFIHTARTNNGNVLICSESGLSSNVGLVAAYLISVYDFLDVQKSLSVLQGLRNSSNPEPFILRQLEEYETPGKHTSANGKTQANHNSQTLPSLIIERRRILNDFGQWSNLKEDNDFLTAALDEYKRLDLHALSYEEAVRTKESHSFRRSQLDSDHTSPIDHVAAPITQTIAQNRNSYVSSDLPPMKFTDNPIESEGPTYTTEDLDDIDVFETVNADVFGFDDIGDSSNDKVERKRSNESGESSTEEPYSDAGDGDNIFDQEPDEDEESDGSAIPIPMSRSRLSSGYLLHRSQAARSVNQRLYSTTHAMRPTVPVNNSSSSKVTDEMPKTSVYASTLPVKQHYLYQPRS